MKFVNTFRLKKRQDLGKSDSFNAMISILPIALLTLSLMLYPLINIFIHGFTKWNITGTTFIGLNNYKNLIHSKYFFVLLKNNLLLFITIPVQIFIALLIAYLLFEEPWGWKFFRALFYLPAVLSSVVIGFLFRTSFSLNGPINEMFRLLHLNFLVVNWLNRGVTAFSLVIFALIWSLFGMPVLIFLSGMDSLDYSIIDSAMVDGANWWQRFFKIIIPMIIGQIEFYTIVLLIIFFTASFGFIFSITSGGPGYSTTTLEYMVYLKAFKTNLLGQSAALASTLFVIVLIFVIAILSVFRKIGGWQD